MYTKLLYRKLTLNYCHSHFCCCWLGVFLFFFAFLCVLTDVKWPKVAIGTARSHINSRSGLTFLFRVRDAGIGTRKKKKLCILSIEVGKRFRFLISRNRAIAAITKQWGKICQMKQFHMFERAHKRFVLLLAITHTHTHHTPMCCVVSI